jgi:hypothetical protein
MVCCFEKNMVEVVETDLQPQEAQDRKALSLEDMPKLLNRSFNWMDFNK